MITRIVKMEFRSDEIPAFLELFESVKHKIGSFPGCLGVHLLRDIHSPCSLFTYSHWNSEADLNKYRNSELFTETWKDTKNKFSHKAMAWSLEEISHSDNKALYRQL